MRRAVSRPKRARFRLMQCSVGFLMRIQAPSPPNFILFYLCVLSYAARASPDYAPVQAKAAVAYDAVASRPSSPDYAPVQAKDAVKLTAFFPAHKSAVPNKRAKKEPK